VRVPDAGRPRPSAPSSASGGSRATRPRNESRWFWVTLLLSSVSIVAVVFAAWELVESHFFRDVDYVTLHYLYVSRGVVSSLLIAAWAAWYVLRQRRRSEEELRESREHYRHLLEASPGAVALYDLELRVTEWNAAAERLYGFTKAEVLGQRLPTVPADREAELQQFLQRAREGRLVEDVETSRRDRGGESLDVQLTLLPFRELPATDLFLEVTTDIRERVRLRERLLEIEKLTSMGKMAGGTAHHLNTPLAAMLIRVQMMRERAVTQSDLERLESDILYCQQFVRRLLELGRRPDARKEPQPIAACLSSVAGFLAAALDSRRVRLALEVDAVAEDQVLADRTLLEALFLSLLSNALDAVPDGGRIAVRCVRRDGDRIEVRVADDGCGISASQLPHVFEPFYTSKGPGKGTGLGLAIARNIVVEHGGSIRLESAPGRGTVASVELPVWTPQFSGVGP
jgi:PAS domain S-box-containing protein